MNYNSLRQALVLFVLMFPAGVTGRTDRTAFVPDQTISRHRPSSSRPPHSARPNQIHGYPASLTKLRAGGILPLATTTAKATSAFLGINGVVLLTQPNAMLKGVYQIEPDSESKQVTTWLLRAIGAVGLGVAIQVYASIVAPGVTPLQAMGYGLIPRAVFFLYSILSGQVQAIHIQQRFFFINTVLTCWCTASLVWGLGNPAISCKIYSFVCLIKSIFFVAIPSKASEKLFGKPFEGQSLALLRGAGNELMTSALLMMASAWGAALLTPVKAAGIVCLTWVVLLADMAWVDKTWRLMGSEGPRAQVVHIAIAGLLAAGFLLPK